MRPLELTVKNFLSYGNEPQTINFRHHSIVCFIGNNGHGKSALLEAITWVLWGQARRSQGVTKSDDMVMHIGSSEMFVSLDTQVKDQIFRIKRTCEKKHNRIYTGLELYSIINEEEKNLSLAHQKETQLLIEKIIGIDYETFINTVYLKQGQSNEFSKKTPKERKDILCSILKINEVEKIRQLLLDDIKIAMQERSFYINLEQRLIAHNKKKIQEECIKEYDLLVIKQQEIQSSFLLETNEFELAKNNLTEKENYVFYLEDEFKKKENLYISYYSQYKILHNQYIRYKKCLLEVEKIGKKYSNKESVEYKKNQEILVTLNQELKNLEIEYDEEKNKILIDQEKELCIVDKKYKEIQIVFMTDKSIILQNKLYFCNELISKNQEELKSCFFCQTDFSLDYFNKKEQYLKKYEEEKKLLEDEIDNWQLKITEQLKILENKRIDIADLQEKKISAIKKVYEKKCDCIKNQIINCKQEEQRYISELKHLEKKSIYESEILEMRNNNLIIKLKKIIITIMAIEKEKKSLFSIIDLNREEKKKIEKIVSDKKQFYDIKIKNNTEIEKIIHEKKYYLGILEKQIAEEEKELFEIKDKKEKIESNLSLQSNLAHILSKDNLQGALIEEAIPVIEYEANIILDKLTQGKFKIYIESMRDLKSGHIKETLDIKIADSVGIRYYEFFSGGESFKIDLSLRIALVKVLAQKSGHSIKTFIIDEGFGSQDNQSLEIMIDTVYALQNEFDLIILISHLSDMKEQFPGQFFIQKTAQGSTITEL